MSNVCAVNQQVTDHYKTADYLGMIYLLHFDQEIGSDKSHGKAQHYMGWSANLAKRLDDHSKGKSRAKIVCNGFKGIGFELVNLWFGTRDMERQLKNRKNHKKICPICKAEAEAGKLAGLVAA